jgi:beta-barrel assembly-enhancing protease
MNRTGWICAAALWAASGTARAQLPGAIKDRVVSLAGRAQELRISDVDEIRLGEDISARIRARYGVVQDPSVHKYVSLSGTVVARKSTRSALPYKFIVLDTDGVNAFAAPGGFVHITRGALALMKNEAELTGVLAHEIAHIAERHTIRAVQKGKVAQMAAEQGGIASNPEIFRRMADECYKLVSAGFGRADEMEADDRGLGYAAAAGYDPAGLALFLTALAGRNAGSDARQGLFASHPEMTSRVERIHSTIAASQWRGGAALPSRYAKYIQYRPVALAGIAAAETGSAGLAGEDKQDNERDQKKGEEKKKSRFSLGRLKNPLGTGEQTRQSAAVTGSGGSRAVDRERDAKGGPNPSVIAVTVTEAEIRLFKTEGKLTL